MILFAAASGDFFPEVGEGFFLAFGFQHPEEFGDFAAGFGLEEWGILAGLEIFPRAAVIVLCAFVDLRGGDAVAEHLGDVAVWHAAADHRGFLFRVVVDPVLEVVLVAALVMEPGFTQAGFEAFCRVRAAVALIVFHTGFKLGPAVFREIMEQALLVEAHAEAVFHNFAFMTVDRPEVMHRIPEVAQKSWFRRSYGRQRRFCRLHRLRRSIRCPGRSAGAVMLRWRIAVRSATWGSGHLHCPVILHRRHLSSMLRLYPIVS